MSGWLQQAWLGLNHWYGQPEASAVLRQQPEFFQVDELLEVPDAAGGEHLWLQIKKRGLNTQDVVQRLSSVCGIAQRNISFSGQKDRHAVTTQWFSVLDTKQQIDPQQLTLGDQVTLLAHSRQQRKLRRGMHKANQFRIVLTQVSDPEATEQRLQQVAGQGVPNYFGDQRFGYDGRNLERALALFAGKRMNRNQSSMALSAARSLLFNQIVSERICRDDLDRVAAGDVMMLAGSRSFFTAGQESDLEQRLAEGDILHAAPLWGKGIAPSDNLNQQQAIAIASRYPEFAEGLAKQMSAEYRPLLLKPTQLHWSWQDNQLTIEFILPTGSFATALLREIVNVTAQSDEHENSVEQ